MHHAFIFSVYEKNLSCIIPNVKLEICLQVSVDVASLYQFKVYVKY